MSGIEKGKDLIKEIQSLLLPRKEIVLAYLYVLIRYEAKRIDFHVETIARYNDVKRLLDTQHQYLSKRLKNGTYGKG